MMHVMCPEVVIPLPSTCLQSRIGHCHPGTTLHVPDMCLISVRSKTGAVAPTRRQRIAGWIKIVEVRYAPDLEIHGAARDQASEQRLTLAKDLRDYGWGLVEIYPFVRGWQCWHHPHQWQCCSQGTGGPGCRHTDAALPVGYGQREARSGGDHREVELCITAALTGISAGGLFASPRWTRTGTGPRWRAGSDNSAELRH